MRESAPGLDGGSAVSAPCELLDPALPKSPFSSSGSADLGAVACGHNMRHHNGVVWTQGLACAGEYGRGSSAWGGLAFRQWPARVTQRNLNMLEELQCVC